MNLALTIARRYLFAKKSHSVINTISLISVAGVMVGTIALVTVLSVYNGFESVISASFSAFNPDLKIEPTQGKTFVVDSALQHDLHTNGIRHVSNVITAQALVRYSGKQTPVLVKGVDSEYSNVTGIDTSLVEGNYVLAENNRTYTVMGYGLARTLGAGVKFVSPLVVYAPIRSGNISLTNPESVFKSDYVFPSGFFLVHQPEFDMNYMLLPLQFVRELFQYPNEVTALELSVEPDLLPAVKKQLKRNLGANFVVLDRYEQQEEFYRMMNIEKWMTFLILTFILFIATFNVIGSLSMLMIDKKNDITTLRNMGADNSLIQRIFMFEGWIISLGGALLGLILGGFICWLQMQYGLLKLAGGGNFIIQAYPVRVEIIDFVLVFVTVATMGFLASYYPVRRIITRMIG
jgi:lipoprotein-releasing system permease protein